jgi:hypothetical protein
VAGDEMQIEADDAICALTQSGSRAVAHTHLLYDFTIIPDGLMLAICEFLSVDDLTKSKSSCN